LERKLSVFHQQNIGPFFNKTVTGKNEWIKQVSKHTLLYQTNQALPKQNKSTPFFVNVTLVG
jgi:hypothetical protein